MNGPAAVSQVAGALHKVASSLSMGDGSGGPSTPQHCMSAITKGWPSLSSVGLIVAVTVAS